MQKLLQFSRQRYVNLETYRRDGHGVQTPLWFVERDGVLYMRTPAASAKVKRIRNNPQVRVVPCDVSGNPNGEWVQGRASLIPAKEAEWVNQLVKRKYGLFKRLIDLRSRLKGTEHVVIAVHL
ncbi:MAG: PPOX class F420-dependent oxidoreductase [Acidobacteria bacterium]|nr:PPOX class F420-dependent oxidoreductase [Acidobacteriota bacterium]